MSIGQVERERAERRERQTGTPVVGEELDGVVDGSNAIFFLSTVALDGSLVLYQDDGGGGIRVPTGNYVPTFDSASNRTKIVFSPAPSGVTLTADYRRNVR